MRSTSRLSACPGASFPSVVTAQVCGTRSTPKSAPSTRPTVRLTPSSATEPFSAMKRASPAGAAIVAWSEPPSSRHADYSRDTVYVARHEVTAESRRDRKRGFQVDLGARSDQPERRAHERLAGKFRLEAAFRMSDEREADTGDGDAVADLPVGSREAAGLDRDPARARAAFDRGHSSHRLDDPGEHFPLSSLA